MITPKIPSSEMWKNMEIKAATNVDSDNMESKSASLPEATRACELMSSPTLFTYLPNASFTTIATAIITSETVL